MQNKLKVVVIGGGNGSAVCLEGLKNYTDAIELSAVISMSDSGGSSGRLRREFNTLPPGDIMRAILSLSKYDYESLRKIFYKPRFQNAGKLDSHNLGNLFLTLASQFSGNFLFALEALSQSVETKGIVYPVTLDNIDLIAELEDGTIIRTEVFIDNPEYNRGLKIKRVWLEPHCEAYDKAQAAIQDANIIILSPGSLYTSIIATLLPNGIKQSINQSKAKIVYVPGNAYRLDGETGPEKLSEMVEHLQRYLPRPIDMVIHNNFKARRKLINFYKKRKWGIFRFDKQLLASTPVESLNLEAAGGGLDPKKVGSIIMKIIKKYGRA
jgi:uncharacterized cofD-like protein